MATKSGPNHDTVSIDGMAMRAVTLAGTNRTEKALFGKNPHSRFL